LNIIYPGDAMKVFVKKKCASKCIDSYFYFQLIVLQSFPRFIQIYPCKNDENGPRLAPFT
jgi:hypothetical protein